MVSQPATAPDSVRTLTTIGCIVLIFFIALGGVLLPLVVASRLRDSLRRWNSMGNAFAAGVLVAAALVHLLPDADTQFRHAYPNIGYPVAYAAAVTGICAMLCVDMLVRHWCIAGQDMLRESHAHATSYANLSSMATTCSCYEAGLPVSSVHPLLPGRNPAIYSNGTVDSDVFGTVSRGAHHHHAPQHVSFALLAALSFHSGFEGIALGTSRVSKVQFATLFFAILAHKAFAALALGISLVSTFQSPVASDFEPIRHTAVAHAVFFAASAPVGAVFGALFSSTLVPRVAKVVAASLSSFSAGIFLFVAFIELLAVQFEYEDDQECARSCAVPPQPGSHSVSAVNGWNGPLCAGLFVLATAAMSIIAVWT